MTGPRKPFGIGVSDSFPAITALAAAATAASIRFQLGSKASTPITSARPRDAISPDVALTADHVLVWYDNGTSNWFGGTSCASPLWAGFTALVNQQAAATDLPPVGFLNPALYTIGNGPNYTSCFHDVTTGNNEWSNSPSAYLAVAGYDLCTGWGTPNGTNLINALTLKAPLITGDGSTLTAESCTTTNGVVDPGETVTMNFFFLKNGVLRMPKTLAPPPPRKTVWPLKTRRHIVC